MTAQVYLHIDIGKLADSLPVHRDFKEAIEFALVNFDESWWVKLPVLCCEAVAGCKERGELLAAAVGLAATAAEILDDIQDGDTHDALWRQIGIGPALNVGISLIFAGQVLLARLEEHGVASSVVSILQQRYAHVGLTMCSGQHSDLTRDSISLNEYWHMVEAKTAAFAAWCCEAGVLVGNPDASPLGFATFGHHLGFLHQMKNDMQGLYGWGGKRDLKDGRRTTLPMVYALSVAPTIVKDRLEELLSVGSLDTERSIQALILHELGFAPFVKMIVEHHHGLALASLQKIQLPGPVFESLRSLLDHTALLVKQDVLLT
jgi:geranylgeranyl pyrophosphate synthase